MTGDEQLTIVLPVKDRAAFTFRWMSYANSIHWPFKVLVADGSTDERTASALSDRTRYPNVAYDHVRYSPDRGYAEYYAKVEDALSRVRTPLVALIDNDDFLVVDGLREAIDFLNRHADYAACGGQSAGFWITPQSPDGTEGVVYGGQVEWKWEAQHKSLTDDTATARLRRKALKTTYATFYHVQRRDDLLRHFQLVRKANPQDLFLFEQFLAFLTAIAGKSKQLDGLYVVRQNNPTGSAAQAHAQVSGDWLGRMLVPEWSADFAAFLEVTSAALAAKDAIPPDLARTHVIEAYRMEVAPAILANLLDEPTVTMSMCLTAGLAQRFLQMSPENLVRRMARTVYRRLNWISADAVHGTELRGRPVPGAAEAFAPIRDFLTRRP